MSWLRPTSAAAVSSSVPATRAASDNDGECSCIGTPQAISVVGGVGVVGTVFATGIVVFGDDVDEDAVVVTALAHKFATAAFSRLKSRLSTLLSLILASFLALWVVGIDTHTHDKKLCR